jgi:uncharacterized protein (TIGR02117 family)
MRLVFLLDILGLLAWTNAGCVSPVKGVYSPLHIQPAATVYVLHRGLHTGVILRTADIPPGVWPQHSDFPQAEFLEVGWGDTDGYRYPWTSRIVLRAMFNSQGSVLLIHGFSRSITNEYKDIAKEIIGVQLFLPGFVRLCKYIQDTYDLDAQGRPILLPSVYSEEKFFRAKGHYSMFKNCNNWTAQALRTAGCPINTRWCVFPGMVMFETRRFGYVIWRQERSKEQSVRSEPCNSGVILGLSFLP